jgi:hypothetical protein
MVNHNPYVPIKDSNEELQKLNPLKSPQESESPLYRLSTAYVRVLRPIRPLSKVTSVKTPVPRPI